MTITADDMKTKGQLLTISQLATELASTEPLDTVGFVPDGDDKVSFNLPQGWNIDLKEAEGTMLTEATVNLHGETYQMTKDAALQATSLIGLQRDYVCKTPGPMVQEHLNFWMKNKPTSAFNLLARKGEALAFTKGTVTPISNVKMLETAIQSLETVYGSDTAILADYKRHHDLRRTDFRLIVPEKQRTIKTARSDATDTWSLGIDVQNSLTAEVPTLVRGYLFAWWCTNGSTSTHATSGAFSRKGGPSEADALEWAADAVDEILGGLEHELDAVSALVGIDIEGEVNTTLQDIFTKYKVPQMAREQILAAFIEADDLTMYGVHAAITQAANSGLFPPQVVARLLQIGGDLPAAASDRCGKCHRLPVA